MHAHRCPISGGWKNKSAVIEVATLISVFPLMGNFEPTSSGTIINQLKQRKTYLSLLSD
jgi:hypothetical protein